MIPTLTVTSILHHSAALRLPSSTSSETRHRIVEEVLQVLGLSKVRDSIVGDENIRGVSGGEKKRVNIGIELVARPTALFLDEPTSGLDSTTSHQLMKYLKNIAESMDIPVVAVLHQPRFILFLSKG
jgi:ABC-type multidrug transport system ATPase subunit